MTDQATDGTDAVAAPGSSGSPAVRALAKPQRQHRIVRLLAEHAVTSQGQLVELLTADGMGGGETVYAIPELPSEQRAPEDHLRRVFSDWVVEVARSANLVVLRTPPGSAHVVGSALDRSGLPGVVGTVAGDDTINVVVAEDVDGAAMAARLSEMAGL